MANSFNRLTHHGRRVIYEARDAALRWMHRDIGLDEMVFGILIVHEAHKEAVEVIEATPRGNWTELPVQSPFSEEVLSALRRVSPGPIGPEELLYVTRLECEARGRADLVARLSYSWLGDDYGEDEWDGQPCSNPVLEEMGVSLVPMHDYFPTLPPDAPGVTT